MRSRFTPIRMPTRVGATKPITDATPSHAEATKMPIRISRPVIGFHEHNLACPAQAVVDEVPDRVRLDPRLPLRHYSVDHPQWAGAGAGPRSSFVPPRRRVTAAGQLSWWRRGDGHGLGRRRSVGVSGTTGVRLRAPVGGNEVTTSGSSRLFSAWSIAAAKPGGASESIGFEKTRLASLPHAGHAIHSGGLPSGRVTSSTPSSSHRYS